MAPSQTMWTVLPRKWNDTTLVIGVAPSPKLAPAGKLLDFPDWLNWPSHLTELEFRIEIEGVTPVPATLVGEPPDAGLWNELFPPDLPVEVPDEPRDPKKCLMVSFPVAEMARTLKAIQLEAAKAAPGERPPTLSALAAGAVPKLAELARLEDDEADPAESARASLRETHKRLLEIDPSLLSRSANLLRAAGEIKPTPLEERLSVDSMALARAMAFRKRTYREQPPTPPRLDFHRAVTLLGDHTALMRKLGLSVELTAELPSLPESGRIRIVIGRGAEQASAWTRYKLEGEQVTIEPSTAGMILDGMLALDQDEVFNVECFDIDAAGLQLQDSVARIRRRTRLIATDASDQNPDAAEEDRGEDALPTLRSAGFSISRAERAERFTIQLSRSRALHKVLLGRTRTQSEPDDTSLDGDDLLRGYRLDVLDEEDGTWRSLHQRTVTYKIGETTIELEEEGYVKRSAAATTSGDDGKDEVFVHEVLFGWDGWSLSAPRPGKTIGHPQAETGEPEELIRPEPKRFKDLPMTVEVRATPGTLPRLRYGRSYQFRARVVDLSGGGLSLDEADGTHATASHRYLRYESVAPPTIVRRHIDTLGETLDRLVIRSDAGVGPEEYCGRSEVSDAGFHPTSERHLAPPKVSQWMAELHGKLDEALGSDGDSASGFTISSKESGTFLDTSVLNTATGKSTVIEDIVLSEVSPQQGDPETSASGARRGSALAQGQYLVRSGAEIPLPYLPDPLSAGVSAKGLPRGRELEHRWAGEWPELDPVRLVLTGGDGAASVEGRTIVVPLGPAEIATIRLSSALTEDAEDLMGLDELAASTGATGKPGWMLAQVKDVEIVHAVQRPLEAPVIESIDGRRLFGETNLDISGKFSCHAASTGSLELLASWKEPVDIVGTEEVEWVEHAGSIATFELLRSETQIQVEGPPIPRLHDLISLPEAAQVAAVAKHPAATRALIASKLIPSGKKVTPAFIAAIPEIELIRPLVPEDDGHDQPRAEHTLEVGQRLAVLQAASKLRETLKALARKRRAQHEFGDTKHRLVSYTLRGATRFPEYFPPHISNDPAQTSVTSEAVELNVLSTARPTAPVIRQTLPAFVWESTESANDLVRTRRGNVVRVLLERPWFSSGEGELLGVVLGGRTDTEADENLRSRWGADPLWVGANPKQPLTPASFPGAIASQSRVTTAESGRAVDVVGHQVEFDRIRKLWVCDVELDAGNALWPFVQLAIARFQPDSVDGAHLSPIVTTDMVQLIPNRKASLRRINNEVEIEVVGPAGHNLFGKRDEPGTGLSREMSAIVETQESHFEGDIGWTVVDGSRISLGRTERRDGVWTWAGRIHLPAVASGLNRRVTLIEQEWFEADPDVAEATVGGRPARSRLVYADSFILNW